MSINFILPAAGFVVTFILLFYFTAKYREAAADAGTFESSVISDDKPEEAKTPATIAATIKRASLGGPYSTLTLEIDDIKEKLKEVHYRGEELVLLSESRNAEILKTLTRLEARLNAFEEEYVQKLQPTLVSLIEDLESMKTQDQEENQ